MQEFDLDAGGWDAFWRRWDAAIREIPELKGAMLERAGSRVRDTVRDEISRSGLNDSRGRVKLWQNRHVGSGKGYVAVRSDSVMVTAGPTGRQTLNAGALTNFLTSGHKVRGPSGRAKRYAPRARMARVPGFHFYRNAGRQAEVIAAEEAENFLENIKGELS